MTVSQAEGLEPLPTLLTKEDFSSELRSRLWSVLHPALYEDSGRSSHLQYYNKWYLILRSYHTLYEHKPIDEFSSSFYEINESLKHLVFKEKWNKILDFFQFVLRHRNCPSDFKKYIQHQFTHCQSPWTIIGENEATTFYPSSSAQEAQNIQQALETLKGKDFAGAQAHLTNAVKEFNAGKYAESIRESISAVESVVKKITGVKGGGLKEALKKLKDNGIIIHTALEGGYSQIYGYTSDKDGIRHAMIEAGSPADEIDAQYMLGSCAAFVSYLVNKARTVKIDVDTPATSAG